MARIESLAGILSPGLLLSFTLLGIFPLLARRIARMPSRRAKSMSDGPARTVSTAIWWSSARVRPAWSTAYIAAAVKAKVTLIEKHRMGGDCLNTGCVPSKTLIRTARVLSHDATRP